MTTNIRRADEKDFPQILALIHEFAIFQKTPEKVSITLEQMKQEKDLFQCLVAQADNGNIIGFASFFLAYYSWSGRALYLDDLYVTEAYRQQKVGGKLLRQVIETAKEEQCKKLRWQVSRWNENAIAFYKSMGASVDDVEINCDLYLH